LNQNLHPLSKKDCCEPNDSESESKKNHLMRTENIPTSPYFIDSGVEYRYCYPWRPEYEYLKQVSRDRLNVKLETEYLVYDYKLAAIDGKLGTSDDIAEFELKIILKTMGLTSRYTEKPNANIHWMSEFFDAIGAKEKLLLIKKGSRYFEMSKKFQDWRMVKKAHSDQQKLLKKKKEEVGVKPNRESTAPRSLNMNKITEMLENRLLKQPDNQS
jgi:hypothetical protein